MAIKDAAGNTIAWVTVAGTLETAQRFCEQSGCKYVVIMGDAPQFWVTTRREGHRLAKAGYEYADVRDDPRCA